MLQILGMSILRVNHDRHPTLESTPTSVLTEPRGGKPEGYSEPEECLTVDPDSHEVPLFGITRS